MQLPPQIIEEVSNVLSETDSKLTYGRMTAFFVNKGNIHNVDIPIKSFIFNNPTTKKSAIKQNLLAFADQKTQLEIILELCELEELKDEHKVQGLKEFLTKEFSHIIKTFSPSIQKAEGLSKKAKKIDLSDKKSSQPLEKITTKVKINPTWLVLIVGVLGLLFGQNQCGKSSQNNDESKSQKISILKTTRKELKSAIDEISKIESIIPFEGNSEGNLITPLEIMKSSVSTFNKRGEILNLFSHYLSKEVSDSLQILHDETSQQIVNMTALAMAKRGEAKLKKPITVDINTMNNGMSEFGKRLRVAFKTEYSNNSIKLEELMK